MKKILSLLVCFLIGTYSTTSAQIIESAEIPKLKNESLIALGESQDNIFFYGSPIKFEYTQKDEITFILYKFKKSNLELLETKEIKLPIPKGQIYRDVYCRVKGLYKNNKFTFFYSVLERQNCHIYSKVFNENLSEEKVIDLGLFEKEGHGGFDPFEISFSPDFKTALLIAKDYYVNTVKAVAVTENNERYEKTNFVSYDLINDKVLFTKKLPIQIDDLKLQTGYYKIDNSGNIIFVATISEKKDKSSAIRDMAIGYLENNKQDFKSYSIDLTGLSSIDAGLYQLKNGDYIFTGSSGKVTKFKYIPVNDISKSDSKELNFPITSLWEGNNGYFINSAKETTANMNKSGEIIYSTSIPTIKPIYYHSMYGAGTRKYCYNNKMHTFFIENKPYELNSKNLNNVEKGISFGVYDYKKFNIVEYVTDETGKTSKNIIDETGTYIENPFWNSYYNEDGAAYFILCYKKAFKIKKIALK